jgi:DNA-binding CsgD family transcriptional regulator
MSLKAGVQVLGGTHVITKQEKFAIEISKWLSLSSKDIEVHRYHIRRKLGIKNNKVNLRHHLLKLR